MKNSIKALITITAILTVAAAMSVGCLAFDNTSNTQSMNELRQRADAYYEKVSGATTNAETCTYNAVKVYIDRIDALRQITERDTSEEMELERQRGEAIGILSWIYFFHIEGAEEFTAEDLEAIGAEYEEQREVIDKAERDFFEGNGVTASYSRMLVEIYTRRLEGLRSNDNGNGLVNGIVDQCQRQVQSRCAYSESFGEDAENCRIYYAEVLAKVTLQTMRDITIEELRGAVESIYPDTEFDLNEQGTYAAFFAAINDPAMLEAYIDGEIGDGEVYGRLNEALYTEVSSALRLPDTCGEYKREYHALLDRTVLGRVTEAAQKSPAEQVRIGDIFSGYALGLLQAEAKDELTDFAEKIGRDPALDIVLLEYTGGGDKKGIIDNTADKDQVETELTAGKMRCVWYDTYRMALVSIAEYLGDGSDKAREARVLYYNADAKIKSGEVPQGGSINERLAAEIAEMNAVVDKAEAEKFTKDHSEIIEKTEIDAGDKDALITALRQADLLSKGAQSFITDVISSLEEKYKGAVSGEINALVRADGTQTIGNKAAYRLRSLVLGLSIRDGSGKLAASLMIGKADLLLEKAEYIGALLDIYCLEYLDGGDEYFGSETEAVVSEGVERLIDASDRSEKQITESYILKVKRAASLEAIYSAAEGYREIGTIPQILKSAKEELEGRATAELIGAYREEKLAQIREVIRSYELHFADESIKERISELLAKAEAYKYISADRRGELKAELEVLRTSGEEKLRASADGSAVKQSLKEILTALSELEARADNEELFACLSYVRSEISNAAGKAEYYTAENYAKILSCLDTYEAELKKASGIEEYLDILSRALSGIGEVEDLLDTAKREGAEQLALIYGRLMNRSHCYSAEGLAELQEIYTHSVTELAALDLMPTEYERAYRFTEERIELMRGVRLSVIYTPDGVLAEDAHHAYPKDHDLTEKGYIGSVSSGGGIRSDAQLSVMGIDAGQVFELLKKAIREKRVFSEGGAVSGRIIRALRRGEPLLGLDVSLSPVSANNGKYRVSVLLPEGVAAYGILGVVAVRADGGIEFFDASFEGSLLEFEASDLSEYYVIGNGSIDLLPLIVCLSVIVVCELCALAVLIIRRRRYKNTAYGIIPIFALASVYRPAGGNVIAVILGVAAAGLLASISYLVYLEIMEARRRKREAEHSREKALVRAAQTTCPIEKDERGETDGRTYEIMASVSAEDAERLMSDTDAVSLQKQGADGYEDTEIYYGDKKSEINIDIIARNFSEGDTVTLNSLKEKRLIPQSAGRVKILAGGTLDKRLRVVAQDFSDAALKMILLTGGEAIVTYSSNEQSKKRKNK